MGIASPMIDVAFTRSRSPATASTGPWPGLLALGKTGLTVT